MPRPWKNSSGNIIGTDVFDYVSGTVGLSGAEARISVFGGDVYVSGSVRTPLGTLGTGGGETFLTTANVTRLSGEMASKIIRTDYAQTSGSFLSQSMWTYDLGLFESVDVEGVLIAFSSGSQDYTAGPLYRRQKMGFSAYRITGSTSFVGNHYIETQTTRSLGLGSLFSASFTANGTRVALNIHNTVGGIIDWSSDFNLFVAKTTSTSYGPSIIHLPSMSLWLRGDFGLFQDSAGTTPVSANNDPVGRWEDKSGNGNHYTQAIAGERPTYKTSAINSQPGIDLDATDDGLVTSFSPTNPMTIFAVWNSRQAVGNSRIINGLGANWLMGPRVGSGIAYYTNGFAGYGAYSANTTYIQTVTQDSSIGSHRVNGVAISGNISGPAEPGALCISCEGAFTNEPADSLLCELIVYSRILTTDEMKTVERYLGTRYNVTVP